MIEIKLISKEREKDINIKNEPFPIFGRMIPRYTNQEWSCTEELFDETSYMCFPDENYNFDEMSESCCFVGAYDGEKCVGLAIYQEAVFKYLYLYDLKIISAYRAQGLGKMLIEKGMELAAEKGYIGIYTVVQDNNLAACRFYLKEGFVIGGFDNKVYKGTSQQDKADIYFYKETQDFG